MVGVQGKITDAVSGRIALKVRDSSDVNGLVDGNQAETLWLDEAIVSANSKFILPATWTLGRQYQTYGMGLLVDNERKSQQGIRVQVSDIFGSNLDFDAFGGGVDNMFAVSPILDPNNPYNFPNIDPAGTGNWATDGYASGRLAYSRPSWSLAANYLATGINDERGWSADLAAQIWGRDVRAEYASLDTNRLGADPNENHAWMASADLWRSSNWSLTGFYSDAELNYSTGYSILNPYYEDIKTLQPGIPWEKWLRNPLVVQNTRVLGGHLNFNVGSVPFSAAYFDVKAKSGPTPFDALWAVSTSKQLAEGVTANLTYAQQMSNWAAADQKLLQASVSVGF
jgi:hypothetical protein